MDLPAGRIGQSLADVWFAHAAASAATRWIVAGAPVPYVLVTLMGDRGSVLDVLLPPAVVPASAKVGVERVEYLGVEPG